MFEKHELLAYFKRGLIPGPSETEEAFLKRARERLPLREWDAVERLPEAWGFSIDWVPLQFSSKKLYFWEGAVFWDTPMIQIQPRLQSKNILTEILHHESIHAARETFDEPFFEEVLAYRSSPYAWKRFLGPIFQRVWEFPLFALACFVFTFLFPVVVFFVLRLIYKQVLLNRMSQKYPLAVLLCLTDKEIRSQKIKWDNSPRCQLISALL